MIPFNAEKDAELSEKDRTDRRGEYSFLALILFVLQPN